MAEHPAWLAKEMERRKFLRRSSQMALGAVLTGSGAQLLGSPSALASERAAAAAAAASATAAVQGITLSGLQTDTSGNTNKTLAEVETEMGAAL